MLLGRHPRDSQDTRSSSEVNSYVIALTLRKCIEELKHSIDSAFTERAAHKILLRENTRAYLEAKGDVYFTL